ncbi:twin-arginine translocase subunit TatC [Zavarzinella formosa]|uniref:twin-arginine translocase subunit TatC n=1 Tax=Zavarzinella formosa TaxID=360055 RepID=UPI00030990BD|nr:twin-arginine translocase subunit TatC [Zavarzinella formosa]
MFGSRPRHGKDYGDDFFKESRMSFGDHLDELRTRMWRAIKGLAFCLVIGFALDALGDALGQKWLGVGKPMLKIITDPVESQVKEFYHERTERVRKSTEEARKNEDQGKISQFNEVRARIPVKALADTFDLKPVNPEQTHVECTLELHAAGVYLANNDGEYVTDSRQYLTGLGVMEAFWVYMKVSLLCGVILACPWIFGQMWAFIGAGLYPHEKKLVHVYMPFSIFLFLGGCLLCQFMVLPRAVEAMLSFYRWINVDPDLRLNEWLGFALVMPLVFGVAFQTPLVMLFFNRIGIFTWQVYLQKWRYAIFTLAVLAAVLTPSTDVISMLWLFVPTMALYMLGILICYMLPPPKNLFGDLMGAPEEEEVAV